MAIHQILTNTVASITDLKKNPMGTVAASDSGAIAILNRNEPAFYCVTPELFEYFQEMLEDQRLNRIADERLKTLEAVKVSLDEL
ncbi:type II toxin-antitoxin system Phd/YefM family antitoxin [Testudinibacter sp. TR-2022]|uniref:type II toxin-antitoxin system Phd/YefM family antitoxin n=1 Tax=Testudinibacter sp. TR-2022 TaxID=2585029 RepID=UPI00111B6D0C|nr:type II toxin-antitoxin system Phd/YefM family antitoxin [Testudinibacter sp. TR-2022]TNH05969.1 type II toxin-antitoxin system Phd/YefM family antitoxin [Pasteurellaceae bacterium Phil11]TNH21803.1 type II toxin-antitoxin system Phd/YefM family antitoxin [Testudinibacter sp. TR-2022]TNH29211.1 type II toxin-antitoxin system Phd/YefM family antitoxin [Testudinibacter sp. TR-2022]